MIAGYDVDMGTERVTVTLDAELLAYARARAKAEGKPGGA